MPDESFENNVDPSGKHYKVTVKIQRFRGQYKQIVGSKESIDGILTWDKTEPNAKVF